MNKDSLLKKEFKKSDVQRVRNLVNKDFNSSTKAQTGYKKSLKRYKEGEVWEEDGKQWTIKNGLRQNITRVDSAKKALRIPLTCPNCGGTMKHWLAKNMYKVHGFCFDPCTLKMEADLRKAGLFKQYEERMMQGNMKAFAKDIEQWAKEMVNQSTSFITEAGDVEEWNSNSNKSLDIMKNLKQYLSHLSEHIK